MSLSMLSCYLLVISSYPDTLQEWLLDVKIKRKRQGSACVLHFAHNRWRALLSLCLGKWRSHAVPALRGVCRESCFSLFYFFHEICVAKHLLFMRLVPDAFLGKPSSIIVFGDDNLSKTWMGFPEVVQEASMEPRFSGSWNLMVRCGICQAISKQWGLVKMAEGYVPWVACWWLSAWWAAGAWHWCKPTSTSWRQCSWHTWAYWGYRCSSGYGASI